VKDQWNAFVREDVVLEPAGEGCLSGLTFAVKDVFAIRGYVSGAGNPDWLRTHEPSRRTALAIERLLQAGARMTGTTHTDEMMFSLDGQNFHYGTPINPRAPVRIPGGSSSGSAVAVSAGLTDFALGTDTGGSVRVPSAYCGIFGFRPTHGAVPVDGVIPLAPSFDTVGWMARDPDVLKRAGLVLLREEAQAPAKFTRLLFPNEAWCLAEPEALGTLLSFAALLKTSSATEKKWLDIAPEGLDVWMRTFRTIQGIEIWRAHGEWIRREKPLFGPDIAERFQWASLLKESEHRPSYERWAKIRKRLRQLLSDDGLLIFPTTPGAAPQRGINGEENEIRRSRIMQLTCIAGLSGLPQATVPAGYARGAPVGLSVVAGPGQDAKLLQWIEFHRELWFPAARSGSAPLG
jgi:amidase